MRRKIYTSGNIQSRDIVSEMEESYLNYSMSVIVSRALPDVRDGLNLCTEEFYMELLVGSPWWVLQKSARIVGEVLGKYPHTETLRYMIHL